MDNLLDWMRQQKAVRIILAVILVFGLLPITSLGTAFANNPDILSEEADGTEGQYAGTEAEAYQTEDEPSTLSGTVWLDANADGIRQIDEELVEGARVYLMEAPRVAMSPETYEQEALADETAALAVAVTDAQGGYSFEGMGAGDYFVKVDRGTHAWPADYSTYNKVGSDGYTRVIAVASGSAVTGIDAGLTPAAGEEEGASSDDDDPHLALSGDAAESTDAEGQGAESADVAAPTYANSLSGFVWADKINDGVYMPEQEVDGEDYSEWPIAGWTVYLLRASDQSVAAETTTGVDGRYEFSDIEPGDYVVKPFYNSPDTQEYQQPRIGLVGANKILSAAESRDWAGTTGIISVAPDTQVNDLDIGMKVKPGYSLQAAPTYYCMEKQIFYANIKLLDERGAPMQDVPVALYSSNSRPSTTCVRVVNGVTNSEGFVSLTYTVTGTFITASDNFNVPSILLAIKWPGYAGGSGPKINPSGPYKMIRGTENIGGVQKPQQTTDLNIATDNYSFGNFVSWINSIPSSQFNLDKIASEGYKACWSISSNASWGSGHTTIQTRTDIDYMGLSSSEPAVFRVVVDYAVTEKFECPTLGDVLQADEVTDTYSAQTVTKTPPEIITKDGTDYYLSGYYLKRGDAAEAYIAYNSGDSVVISDIYENSIIRYQYSPRYTVDFDVNGSPATPPASKTIAGGGKVAAPGVIAWPGYKFTGWFKEASCTNKWDFETDVVMDNMTLYAGWAKEYTLSFNANGGSPTPANETVAEGFKATKPADPTKAGYNFKGWFESNTDNNGSGTEWVFGTSTMPSANKTLYAKWEAKGGYTVNYNTDGGNTITAKTGVTWTQDNLLPANPTKAGSTFNGWKVTTGNTAATVSATSKYSDLATGDTQTAITLTAQWTAKNYTVQYNTDGGGTLTDKTNVKWGDANLWPATAPTKTGYECTGWTVESGGTVGTNVIAGTKYSDIASNDSTMTIKLKAVWTVKNTYKVNYDFNGGTSTATSRTNVKWTDSGLLANPLPTRTGYNLTGWTVTVGDTTLSNMSPATAATKTYSELAKGNDIPEVTLKAEWMVKSSYTVTYIMDGGTPVVTARNGNVGWLETGLIPATAPTRTDWTFAGWKVTGGSSYAGAITTATPYSTLAAGNDSVMAIELTAQWSKNPTAIFESNGGSSVPSQNKAIGSLLTKPSPDPTRTGYTFAAWYKEAALTNAWNFASDTMPAGGMTLYAKWNEKSAFSVNYVMDGGTPVEANKAGNVKWTQTGLIPATNPTKPGYNFAGWKVTAGGSFSGNVSTTNTYSDLVGGDDTKTSVTLTATWTEKTNYSVRYNYDGGASTATNPKTGVAWTATGLTANPAPTKAGYTLTGWTVTVGNTALSNMSLTDAAAKKYSELAGGNEVAEVTLKAVWTEKNSYKVNYDFSGGTSSASSKTNVKWTDTGLLANPLPTRSGYDLTGWTVTVGDTTLTNMTPTVAAAKKYSELAGGNEVAEVTLKAVWTESGAYKVRYDFDGGSSSATNPKTGVAWTATNLTANPAPTKAGYTLTGWTVTVGDTTLTNMAPTFAAGKKYSELSGGNDIPEVTLKAVWTEKDSYKVNYDYDGGSPAPASKTNVKWTDTGLLPGTAPTKAGYSLTGWTVTVGDTGLANMSLTTAAGKKYSELAGGNDISEVTLKAVWTEKGSYKVNYDFNNGTSTAASKTNVKWTDAGLLANPLPTRTGYNLTGWSVTVGDTTLGTMTPGIATAKKYSELAGGNDIPEVTLKAEWTEKSNFTVTYKMDNGTPVVPNRTGNVSWTETGLIPTTDPTRTNYSFAGWKVTGGSSYAGTITTATPYSTLAAGLDSNTAIELTAQWSQDPTALFESNGGSSVPSQNKAVGSLLTKPSPDPTRTGYTFAAWYKEAALTNLWNFASDTMPTGGTTLYAKWNEKSNFSVSYVMDGGTPAVSNLVNNVKWTQTGLVPASDPTKAGYSFTGWKVTAGGTFSGNVSPANTYSDLVNGDDTKANVTLTATWAEKSNYQVTYVMDGGTPAEGPKTSVKWTQTGLIPTTAPTKTNFTFQGWKVTAGGPTKTVASTDSYGSLVTDDSVASLELTAQWKASDFSVTKQFFKKDGSQLMATTTTPNVVAGTTFDPASAQVQTVNGEQWVLIGWKVDGDTNWRLPNAAAYTMNAATNIMLRYDHDYDKDGNPDIKVTKHYKSAGSTIKTSDFEIVNLVSGAKFDSPAPAIGGFTYENHQIDGGTYTTGDPYVALNADSVDFTVTYNYMKSSFDVNVHHVDRNGGMIAPSETIVVTDGSQITRTSTPVAIPVASVTEYALGAWKVGAAGAQIENNNPIVNITGATDIYLIYGQDKGNDKDEPPLGPKPDTIEDVSILKKWETTDGSTTLKPATTVYRNVPGPFIEAGGTIAGYKYVGYRISGDATQHPGTPYETLVGGKNFAITYLYEAGTQSSTLMYENRAGDKIRADETVVVTVGDLFVPSAAEKTVTDYVLVDWKLDDGNGWRGNASPSLNPVEAQSFTMTLRYGQDKGNDKDEEPLGPKPDTVEDVTITKQWQSTTGKVLKPDAEVYRNVPGPFKDAGGAVDGYAEAGFKIDGGTTMPGKPNLALVAGTDHMITYIYVAAGQASTIKYVDRSGATVRPTENINPATDSVFIATAAQIAVSNYTLVDWKLEGEADGRGNISPQVTTPFGGFKLVLIYGQDKGNDKDEQPDGPAPDGIEDVTVKKMWQTTSGTPLKASMNVYRNVPGPFADPIDTISGYTYKGFKVDGGAFVAAPDTPEFNLVGGTSHTVLYMYADETPPATPTIDPVKPHAQTVSGTGDEPGNTITVTFPDGKTATTTVQPNGTWMVAVPVGTDLLPGQLVKATETDPAGNVSPEGMRKVSPEAPSIDPVHPGDDTITGEGTPGNTIDVVFPDGSTGTAVVDDDGTWEVPVPSGTTLDPGDEVKATEKDGDGNTSDPAKATVTPAPPTIDPIHPGDIRVTGEGNTPGDTITVTFPDGTTATTTVKPDKTWTVPVPSGMELEPGDEVKATESDKKGNESDPAERAVSPYAPVIDPIKGGDDTISGEGTPGSTIDVLFPDGETATTVVEPDGTWEVPVPAGTTLEDGDEVIATETDPATGETSNPSSEIVGDTTPPAAPTINPIYPDSTTITGKGDKPGNTITVTLPDGSTAETKVQPNGKWEVPVPAGIDLQPGDVVKATETSKDGLVSDEGTRTVSPYGPIIHPITEGDRTVEGEGVPGDTIVVTFPDGKTATTVVDPDGNWSVPVPSGTDLLDGDEVTAIAKDDEGNTSHPTTEVVGGNDVVRHIVMVSYQYKDGSALFGAQVEKIREGQPFNTASKPKLKVPSFKEKVLIGYTVNGVRYDLSGNIVPLSGSYPGVDSVTEPTFITLIYGQDKVDGDGKPGSDGIEDFTITEIDECSDGHGTLSSTQREVYVNKGATYTAKVQTYANHTYASFSINNSAKATGIPRIENVQADHTVVMYHSHADGNADEDNYDFTKTPSVKNAKPGSTVDYTMTKFDNRWGKEVSKFSISDLPDKGLDFVSASLPAFTDGTGVSYDVVLYTNVKTSGFVYQSALAADRSQSISAPTLASGEYITAVVFEFDRVGAGFGKGDSLTLRFRVWDNPPAATLGNLGALSYMVDDVPKDFESGGDGTQVVVDDGSGNGSGGGSGSGSGKNPVSYTGSGKGASGSSGNGLAKMGDTANLAMLAYLASIAALTMFIVVKRRKKEDEASVSQLK